MITLGRVFSVLALTGLVACGGGGGGGGDGFDGYKIPIAAGTGAALAGASVIVGGLGASKTFTCSGTTDENGYITCNVPASYTPPFMISVYPADGSNNISTVVVSANKGNNLRVPVTPLTTLLVEADWDYLMANTTTTEQAKARLEARKKQITDALAPLISLTLDAEKAKTFDFLTDSSFAPGSHTGSDLLLDSISVDIQSLKVSLKNGSKSSVTFTANTDPTKTTVTAITASPNDIVNPTTTTQTSGTGTGTGTGTGSGSGSGSGSDAAAKTLADFAGEYGIDVKWRLSDGSASGNDYGTVTIDKDGKVTQCADFTIFISCIGQLTWDTTSNGAEIKFTATGSVDEYKGTAFVKATVDSTYVLSGVMKVNSNGNQVAEGLLKGSKFDHTVK
jgi:hypothetical protein